MQTRWGELRVSDAHVHFFSHGFFSALAAQRKSSFEDLQPLLDWQLPAADPANSRTAGSPNSIATASRARR